MKSLIRLAKEKRERGESRIDNTKVSLQSELDVSTLHGWVPTVSVNIADSVGLEGVSISNDFLPVSLADSLMSAFESAESSFVQLRGRRCLPLGGRVTSSGLLPADNIPLWLSELMDYVFRIFLAPRNLPRPNHALVNVYAPGEGIMAHEDGPAYTPYATILSVGSSSVFDFVEKSSDRSSRARVYLPVGSLLIFESAAYTDVLHEFKHSIVDDLKEINFSTNDRMGESRLVDSTTLRRGKRISVTMRHVPVVD